MRAAELKLHLIREIDSLPIELLLPLKDIMNELKKVKKKPKSKSKAKWTLEPEQQTELLNRLDRAKKHPEHLLTWEQIIKNIEKKHGIQIKI